MIPVEPVVPCAGASTPRTLLEAAEPVMLIAKRGNTLAVASAVDATLPSDTRLTWHDLLTGREQSLVLPNFNLSTLSVTADTLLWIGSADRARDRVERLPLVDAGTSTIEVVWEGAGVSSRGTAQAGDRLFFSSDADGIVSVGPHGERRELLRGVLAEGLAADADHVYFTGCAELSTLNRVSVDGSAATPVASFSEWQCPRGMASDGAQLFFGLDSGISHLYTLPVSGGEPIAIGAVEDTPHTIELDARAVYTVTTAGLQRTDRVSLQTERLRDGLLSAFALDEHCVYWSELGDRAVYTQEKGY